MKQQFAIANALAITTAVIYILCRVLVGLFPDASFTIAQSWFHGIEINQLGTWNLTFGSFALGLISATITTWIMGYIFTKVYTVLQNTKL